MNSIEKMIAELCPEGVEYRKLGEILDYEQPTPYIIKAKEYKSYGTPVLTAGQTFILGYTDEENGIFRASKKTPVIIFDDFTTSFHWVDFDFKIKSSAMKMLRPKNEENCFRFVYHAMKCIKYEVGEHSRQWISKYSNFEIPLPPLSIQRRIVEVLDKFTELTAELTARRRQYEYYRNQLLSFGAAPQVPAGSGLQSAASQCLGSGHSAAAPETLISGGCQDIVIQSVAPADGISTPRDLDEDE